MSLRGLRGLRSLRSLRGLRRIASVALAVAVASAALFSSSACAPPELATRPPRAPATPDPLHETGFFTASGGITLFEQSWHPEGPPRAVVVIHHGLKSHSDHYDEVAHRLTALGYAVYGYDMRGHGRSEGRRAALDDFEDLVEDLSIFLARVRARQPHEPIFLMGHSVGGAVVTLFTLERRPAIAGLVVLAPAIRVDSPPMLAAAAPLTATLMPNFPAVDVPDEAFSRDPATLAAMARDPLVYHPAGPARTAGGLLAALERVWRRAGELDVPLLALHGTADRATDPRGSAELVQRARSRDKTLFLYRGLYHDLFHEPEREQVMSDVFDWLNRRAPARAQAPDSPAEPSR
jgi:acylglycerol lipase